MGNVGVSPLVLLNSVETIMCPFSFCVPGGSVSIDVCTNLRHGGRKSKIENTDVCMALWEDIPVAFTQLHQGKQILPDQFLRVDEITIYPP